MLEKRRITGAPRTICDKRITLNWKRRPVAQGSAAARAQGRGRERGVRGRGTDVMEEEIGKL